MDGGEALTHEAVERGTVEPSTTTLPHDASPPTGTKVSSANHRPARSARPGRPPRRPTRSTRAVLRRRRPWPECAARRCRRRGRCTRRELPQRHFREPRVTGGLEEPLQEAARALTGPPARCLSAALVAQETELWRKGQRRAGDRTGLKAGLGRSQESRAGDGNERGQGRARRTVR